MIPTPECFLAKTSVTERSVKRVVTFSNGWVVLQIFIKGHQQKAYLGSNERVPKPSKAVSNVQLGDLKQRVKKILCDKADTLYSGKSEINCDIFHLFVNASLAVHSLKMTVASYSTGEVMVKQRNPDSCFNEILHQGYPNTSPNKELAHHFQCHNSGI